MYMAGEHAKILYVEDDKTLSFITKENLEKKAYSISFCEDGEQDLRILKSLWEEDDFFPGRSMDVFISRLSKYLKPVPSMKIENGHGTGFILRHYK